MPAADASAARTHQSESSTHKASNATPPPPTSSAEDSEFCHVRYPAGRSQTMTTTPEMEMPGTPPLEGLAALDKPRSARSKPSPSAAARLELVMDETCSPEDRPRRRAAAIVLQCAARNYLARRERALLNSAVGRPAQVRVMSVTNIEMLCDYRDVTSVYCIVRILKKPYGPFMFQFSSTKCTHVNLPTWNDEFFVPMISSRCEIVVTLVGVSTSGRLRFLGQSVTPLDTGWEKQRTESTVPLGKWTFPVDAPLVGMHRFVKGSVCCAVTPLTSRNTCVSGQFQMAPTVKTAHSSSLFGWTRRRHSLPLPMASPQGVDVPQTPTAVRKEMVTRWGVLTDTHLHLFADSTAKLVASLELSKLQLIKSAPLAKNAKSRREPGRLYALKLYCNGTLYSLFVTKYAQQLAWEFKIDYHRRQLLIP